MAGPRNTDKEVTIVDGSVDFSGGVNSYVVPTIASEINPYGLKRNQVAWMSNATVRGGGITQRPSWKSNGIFPAGASGNYHGAFMYEPTDGLPYIIAVIGGHVWKIDPDDPSSGEDLSIQFTTVSQTKVTSVTDQVQIILRNDTDPGAGTASAGGTNATIGTYMPFLIPVIGSNVRVPTMVPYTGALGGTIFLTPPAGRQYTIMGVDGFVTGTSADQLATLPSTIERAYFCQAEEFLVIQADDLVTLPLIWDGVVLRRSVGLTGGGTVPPRVHEYGLWVGIPPTFPIPGYGQFTIPAQYGVSQIDLINPPYVGNIGDHIAMLPAQTLDGANNVIYYPYTNLLGWVTAINPTSIDVQWYSKADWIKWSSYISTSAPPFHFVKLTYATANQYTGSDIDIATPEIPAATAMDYFMGRLWYAQNRTYSAGDIVGSQASGTLGYNFRDSVLKVTENPLAIGGDGFTVPTNSGNIRAIRHSANLNTQLGQGQLYIFTRESIYALTVPVTRAQWIATTNDNQPLQTVVQITNGAVNDRCIAEQNGDLFYQSFEPAIRSLIVAVRNFQQWGNVPISINENRILKFNDRSLMRFCSGVSFDNRMLQLVLPEVGPVGVVHRAVVPLNFDVISTMEAQLPPVWEGMLEGAGMLEILNGDFGGRPRCFAPVWSDRDLNIQLWEISTAERFENGDNRVQWYVEFPAYTWGNEFMLKRLVSAELWIDRIYGEVMFSLDWRVDGDPCWYRWNDWKVCTARDSTEDVHSPETPYPKTFCESFRQTITQPLPPNICQAVSGRPANVGYQFQPRLTIKGFCRIRGILLKAEKMQQPLYGSDMVC